jgi:DNA-binding NarL/FixJ family response regulator
VAEATRLHGRAEPDAWAESAETWERLQRPSLAAYARWREAEARLSARGNRDEAAAALRSALAIADRLGAAPLAREIHALAGRARLNLTPDEPEATAEPVSDDSTDDAERFGLTAREREVLGLVALGRTNRQIAAELFISENTAGVHVSRILGKLEVASRGEAAAIAYRLGMTEPAREPA